MIFDITEIPGYNTMEIHFKNFNNYLDIKCSYDEQTKFKFIEHIVTSRKYKSAIQQILSITKLSELQSISFF